MKTKNKRLLSFMAAFAVMTANIPGSGLAAFANTYESAEKVNEIGTVDMIFENEDDEFWYLFTAPEDGVYIFESLGYYNTYGYLYADKQTEIASNGYNFRLEHKMLAGDQVYVKATSIEPSNCQLQITVRDIEIKDLYNNYDSEWLVSGDIMYYVNDDNKTVTISGCKLDALNVTVPETIDGKKVTRIADGAFMGCWKLTSITLPDTVNEFMIKDEFYTKYANTFANCVSLTSVNIPKSLEIIPTRAFQSCTSLKSIDIPDNVTFIDYEAFSGCTSLKSIGIPDNVIHISPGAFSECGLEYECEDGIYYYNDWMMGINEDEFDRSIKELVIKDGTKNIMDHAFSYCFDLESVTIPESVRYIGEAAFGDPHTDTGDDGTSGLHKLRKVTIKGNGLVSIGDNAFAGDDALVSINLPDTVEEIGRGAFAYTALVSVDLPENLKSIGNFAFAGTNISNVILPENVTYVGTSAFSGSQIAVIPSTVTNINRYMMANQRSGWGNQKSDVFYMGTKQQLLDSLLTSDWGDSDKIDENDPMPAANVHYDCQLVTKDDLTYVISDGKAYILQCNRTAESVTIPEKINDVPVTSILPGAFKFCADLKKLDIPGSIQEIGEDAFDECPAIEHISFPKGVTLPALVDSIDPSEENNYTYVEEHNGFEDLFDGCSSLTDIVFDKDDPTYFTSGGAVYTRSPQKLIFVPEAATELNILDGTVCIANCAVESCVNITVFSGIPESVTEIQGNAFRYSGFTSIVLPDSVTKIGAYAFCLMPNLESIVLPKGLEVISNNVFGGDFKLTSVTIPDGVAEIQNEAFYNCTALRKLYIPESVEEFGYGIFVCPDPNGKYSWSSKNLDICIYGESNSMAESYASSNGLKFCAADGNYVNAEGTERKTYDNLIYGFAKDGSIVITGCSEDAETLNIPAAIDGIAVTAIEPYAFQNNSKLTSVTVPDSVKSIGAGAFENCAELTDITLPKTLPSVESRLFSGCEKLKDVAIPEGIAYIGKNAFAGCSALESIVIPDGVKSIGNGAFGSISGGFYYSDQGCSSLTSVTIPDSVKFIGANAFESCTALENIVIPEGVTSIGERAFAGCESLTSINIPDGVTEIDDYTFAGCSALESIVIPDGVTSIGKGAFGAISNGFYNDQGCSSLTSVTIPNSVKSIGANAFEYCTALENIVIPDGVTSIGERAFAGCKLLTSINIPDDVTEIDDSTFAGCSSLKNIVIPDGLTSIGEGAFYYCKSLANITIPDGVTSIGAEAFEGCKSLTSIIIPDGVTKIGHHTFLDCSALEKIVIPDSVTEISNHTFFNCSALENIVIPDSVTSIGDSAFYDCKSLTNVNIPDGVTEIGSSTFYNCSALESIVIPDGVTSIGNSAFYGCSSLTSITIPDGVTEIGYRTFYNCSALESIIIPDSVTSIGEEAFNYCRSLTSINIPDGVTSIGECAFDFCESLTSVNIPDGVTEICNKTFFSCSALESIVIPDSVTSIGNSAFDECISLTSINIPDGVTSIGDYAFTLCSKLTNINIPDGVTEIGYETFANCYALEKIVIPNSVTNIDKYAFNDCESLTSIDIPESVTKIDYKAFENCSAMKKITILNPDCEIDADYNTLYYSTTICGYKDSTAQAYAEKNERQFESLGEAPIITTTTTTTTTSTTTTTTTTTTMTTTTTTTTSTPTTTSTTTSTTTPTTTTTTSTMTTTTSTPPTTSTTTSTTTQPTTTTTTTLTTSSTSTSSTSTSATSSTTSTTSSTTSFTTTYIVTEYEDFTINKYSDHVDISGYTGEAADVIIPAEIDELPVLNIGENAFKNCTSLESITILNPECKIADVESAISDSFDEENEKYSYSGVIKGSSGSAAEEYAKKYNRTFEAIEPAFLLGDVTQDGIINGSDATLALRAYTLVSSSLDDELDDIQFKAADVDGDGKITGSDATLILRYYTLLSSNVNGSTLPPMEEWIKNL